jgi:hypothetical protein
VNRSCIVNLDFVESMTRRELAIHREDARRHPAHRQPRGLAPAAREFAVSAGIHRLPLAACLVLAGTLAAPARAETPNAPFDSIEISGSAVVRYTQGPDDQAQVEGDEEMRRSVRLQVHNGQLQVQPTGSWKFWKSQRVQVNVSSRELRRVAVSGAADFLALQPVQAENLAISISGAGLARFEQLRARLEVSQRRRPWPARRRRTGRPAPSPAAARRCGAPRRAPGPGPCASSRRRSRSRTWSSTMVLPRLSICQLCAAPLPMTSSTSFMSSPALLAEGDGLGQALHQAGDAIWLTILASCPAPLSPMRVTARAKASATGFIASKARRRRRTSRSARR